MCGSWFLILVVDCPFLKSLVFVRGTCVACFDGTRVMGGSGLLTPAR